MLAEWVATTKFSGTRLRPGYHQEEVCAFLEAIRDSFLGVREPSLTPDEIRVKQFSITRLLPGYDEEEVNAFLDEAESRLAAQLSARREAPAAEPRSGAADPAVEPPDPEVTQSGEQPQDGLTGQPRMGELDLDAGSLPIQNRPATNQAYLIVTAGLAGGLVSVGLAVTEMAEYVKHNRVGNLAIVGMVIGVLAGYAVIVNEKKPPGRADRINTVAAWLAFIGVVSLVLLYGGQHG